MKPDQGPDLRLPLSVAFGWWVQAVVRWTVWRRKKWSTAAFGFVREGLGFLCCVDSVP